MLNNEIFDISDAASHDKYIEFLKELGVQFMTREMALEIGRKRHGTKDGRPRKRNWLSMLRIKVLAYQATRPNKRNWLSILRVAAILQKAERLLKRT